MADDLTAFFAKKKDKKKKTAVKMDDIGQTLERRARRQEEHDQHLNDEDKRMDDDVRRNGGEDSEWIEYNDSNQGRLEGLAIKDMGAEDAIVEEEQDVEEQKEQHEGRTWGQVEKTEEKDVQTAADMAAYQHKRDVFVPTALRVHRGLRTDIDVSNQEMFPSLADASKMETAKKEDVKSGGGWVKTGQSENRPVPVSGRPWGSSAPSGPPVTSGKDRESAMAALKALTAQTAAQAPAIPRPAPVEEVKKASAANAYVPPHLRNRT